MNELDAFEQKLRRIKPAEPSAGLIQKLQSSRPGPAVVSAGSGWNNFRKYMFRVGVPLAAAAALLIIANRQHDRERIAGKGGSVQAPVRVAGQQVRPAETVDYILGARELGICRAPDGSPYKVVQCVGLSRQVWENTGDGRRLAQTVPQQRVLLVKMNTY